MSQHLNDGILSSCLKAVCERLRLQTTSLRMIENHTREAIMDGNKTRSSHLGRDIFVLQRDTEVENILIPALQRLQENFTAFLAFGGPGRSVVRIPAVYAQDLGVIAFCADVLAIPELSTLKEAIYGHIGLRTDVASPSVLPGWGTGPGESAKMKGIIVPEDLVKTYPPPFQPPTPEEAQQALIKLVDSFLAQAQQQQARPPSPRGQQFPTLPKASPRGGVNSSIPPSLTETSFSSFDCGTPNTQFPVLPNASASDGSTVSSSLLETSFSTFDCTPDSPVDQSRNLPQPPSPTIGKNGLLFPPLPAGGRSPSPASGRNPASAQLNETQFSNTDFEETFSKPKGNPAVPTITTARPPSPVTAPLRPPSPTRGRNGLLFPALPPGRAPSPVVRKPSPAALNETTFSNSDFEETFSKPKDTLAVPPMTHGRSPSPSGRCPSPAFPPLPSPKQQEPPFPPSPTVVARPSAIPASLQETNFSNLDFEEPDQQLKPPPAAAKKSPSPFPQLPQDRRPSPVAGNPPPAAALPTPSTSTPTNAAASKPSLPPRKPSGTPAAQKQPPKGAAPRPPQPSRGPTTQAGQRPVTNLPAPVLPSRALPQRPPASAPGQRTPRALPPTNPRPLPQSMTDTQKERIADSVPPPPLTETMKQRIADQVPPPPLTETMKQRIADQVPPPPLTETMKQRIADSVPPPPLTDSMIRDPHARRCSEAYPPKATRAVQPPPRAKSMMISPVVPLAKVGSAADAIITAEPKSEKELKKEREKEEKERKEREKREKKEKERLEKEKKEKEKKEREKREREKKQQERATLRGKTKRKDDESPAGTKVSSMSLQFCEPKNMPVEISPLELTFGLSSRQAPVDSEIEDTITIHNPQKYSILCAAENLTDEEILRKAKLEFEPSGTFVISSNSTFQLKVKLTLLCTAKFHFTFGIKAWRTKSPQVQELKMTYATESQLTTRLDPDEIKKEELIGKGAYGVVYSGRYRGMDVAIKLMKFQDCMTRGMKEDFLKEIDMMEKLRHNCIVNFIGAVLIPGQMQIVTELCPYGSLLSAIRKYPKDFTMALKIKCLLDAANGMDFLHQSGIIHRDLKPDNLLMVSLQPRASVACKISDFGTTRDVNEYAKDMLRTEGVGTPLFMAPEILASKPYDRPVDVYSFSYIIYVAYAEMLPFENDKIAATPWGFADAIRSGTRPAVPRNCPPEVARLMVFCWDDDPAKRPTFEVIHKFFRSYFQDCFMDKP